MFVGLGNSAVLIFSCFKNAYINVQKIPLVFCIIPCMENGQTVTVLIQKNYLRQSQSKLKTLLTLFNLNIGQSQMELSIATSMNLRIGTIMTMIYMADVLL